VDLPFLLIIVVVILNNPSIRTLLVTLISIEELKR